MGSREDGVKDAMGRFFSKAPGMDLPKPKAKRRKAKDGLSEEMIQNRLVSLLRGSFDVFLFSVPMGGARTAHAGARLKRGGALKGCPDLILLTPPCSGFKGVCWELKKDGGRVSPEQLAFMSQAAALGFLCVIVSGLDANLNLARYLYEKAENKRTEAAIISFCVETDGVRIIS